MSLPKWPPLAYEANGTVSGLGFPNLKAYNIRPVEGLIATSVKDQDPIARVVQDTDRSWIVDMEYQLTRGQFTTLEQFHRRDLRFGVRTFRMPVWEERGIYYHNARFASAYTMDVSMFGWKVKFLLEIDNVTKVYSELIENSAISYIETIAGASFTGREEQFLIDFIEDQDASGNWDKLYEYWFFIVRSEIAALVGLKTGAVTTIVNPSGLSHIEGVGLTSDGSSGTYLNTHWNINEHAGGDVDLIMGAFVHTNDDTAANNVSIMGMEDTGVSNDIVFRLEQPSANPTQVAAWANEDYADSAKFTEGGSGNFDGGFYYTTAKVGGNTILFRDQTFKGSVGTNAGGQPHSADLVLFAHNTGTPVSVTGEWDGILSSAYVAKWDPLDPFNIVSFMDAEANLRSLISTSPEASLVLSRLPGLTTQQYNAIEAFVDGCVTDGNWGLVKEFYCLVLPAPNSLKGFLQKTATAHAGATYVGDLGYRPSAAASGSYVDTKWNPAVDSATREMIYGCYVSSVGSSYDYDPLSLGLTAGSLFGISNFNFIDARDSIGLHIGDGLSVVLEGLSGMAYGQAWNSAFTPSITARTNYLSNTIYNVSYNSSNINTIYEDTTIVSEFLGFSPSVNVSGSIYILKTNYGPSGAGPVNAHISAWWVADNAGFDYSAFNARVDTLMSDLGVTGA